MAAFGLSMTSKFGTGATKDQRRAIRKKVRAQHAWIRLDGFAVRPCAVVDLSDTGVQIEVGKTQLVPKTFTFLRHGMLHRVGVPKLNGDAGRRSAPSFYKIQLPTRRGLVLRLGPARLSAHRTHAGYRWSARASSPTVREWIITGLMPAMMVDRHSNLLCCGALPGLESQITGQAKQDSPTAAASRSPSAA